MSKIFLHSYSVVNENILAFIFGSKAEFTILQEAINGKKEVSVRYRVSQSKNNKDLYFVSTQPLGNTEIVYHGYIYGGNYYKAKTLKFDPTLYNNSAIKALLWVLSKGDNLPTVVHVLHHGKCSRCGRKLKDIESLRCGMGPECRKKSKI